MWLPDNELAMTGDDGGVLNVWWLPDGSSVAGMTAHKMPIRSVAFNITGFYILSGSFDKSLKLFSNTYGEFPYKMLHDGAVNSVTFAPYSIYALSASEDKTIKYWNMENGLNLATFTGHTRGVTQVAYMPNARAAVSSSRDSTIKAWDLASGRCRRTIEVTSQANCITPSSDGRLVATGLEDGSIKIYENVNGSLFQSLYGHNAGVNSIKFSHSNNYIISGSRDRTVRYFHISSGTSRILGAAIRITSPKEGETWLPATYREVKWEFLAVDSLFIDLSTNAGSD